MARILWSTVAVLAIGLLGVATKAQQSAPTSGAQRKEPPASGIAGLRMQMKRIDDMRAQALAGEIGPPPADCRVDVSHIDDDELGEGIAESVADVFRRAHWAVEVSSREQLTSTPLGILIHFSPATATAAAKLQAAFNHLEPTDIAPISIEAPHSCRLDITVSPQFRVDPQ